MNEMEEVETNPDASKPEQIQNPLPAEVSNPAPTLTPPIPPQDAVAEAPNLVTSQKSVTPQTPQPQIKPEDRLYAGNVVVESQKKEMPAPQPPTQGANSARAMRELGLSPRQSVPEVKPELKLADDNRPKIPRIRTYAADMGEEIRKRGETLSTIVSAEQERGETQQVSATERAEKMQRIVLIGGAGLLVVAGIAVIAGVFLFSGPKEPAVPYTPLISVNASVLVPGEAETDLAKLLGAERTALDLNLGEIAEAVVVRNNVRVSPSELLTMLGAPGVVARNATDILIGIHAFNRNQPFILVEMSAYDLAFQGMLEWEPSLAEDLGDFFAPVRSTSPVPPAILRFSDKVYQNIDVRVSDENWQIVYAFPGRNLLLITTNDSTLREILTRLALNPR